jgi:hypothetical protein
MLNLRKALKAEPEFLPSTSISTASPSKSISVSSTAKESLIVDETSAIHLAIALLSGLWASQDNKFNFIIILFMLAIYKS